MSQQTIPQFNIIGISVRTANTEGRAATDIPALWNTFISENIAGKIPGKMDDAIYCLYTDYEKDHTQPYTTILGCKVSSLDHISEGMTGKIVAAADYVQYTAKGDLMQGVVYAEWVKIWNADLPRTYTTDFEVYGPKAQNPGDAEVDIFIAVEP